MFSVDANEVGRLVTIIWWGKVDLEQLRVGADEILAVISNMRPGFRVLVDMTGLESMDPAGAPYIGTIMDLCLAKQVERVVRVIPDPNKDIGFNIMSYFHYGSSVQVVTCENLSQAIQALA
jgi:anti-anti-sigma regulatory factor